MARRMGVGGELRRDLTLALGTSEVTLLELTAAYGVIANRGVRVPVGAIRQVVGPGGNVRWERPVGREPVLSEDVAFLLTSLLQGVIERGTGRRAQALGLPAAGKTGTSQDATDLWFVGFTPSLVAGVWVGYDTPRSMGPQESGGRIAVPVWTEFMRRALRGSDPAPFPRPDGVYAVLINPRTGEPAAPGDPEGFTEYFLRGPNTLTRGAIPALPMPPRPAPPKLDPDARHDDIAPPWKVQGD